MTAQNDCVRDVRLASGVAIVTLVGEVDMHHVPEVHATLTDLCGNRPSRLVINLEKVSYMDSSGLGTLVALLRRVRTYGGGLALCNLPERVRGLFEITRLDRLFSIFPTEAEALAG